MASKVVKLGVVGLGRGQYVVEEIVGEKNVLLTAICDHNPEKLNSAREKFEKIGVKDLLCCDNYEDILKTDIDAIYIATDAICHVSYVIKALEAGKHVLSEIPAVNSLH